MTLPEIRASIPAEPLVELGSLPYPHTASGKVREIYELPDAYLMIATDRLSAFDVVLPTGIAGKGILLTQISLHWFAESASLIQNHLVENHHEALKQVLKGHEQLIPRSMLVRKMRTVPIEAVVRAYLSGSGWKSYLRTGTLFGQPLPAGLLESSKLPTPMFTPTTKAAVGNHDEPMSIEDGIRLLGEERFEEIRDVSMKLFALGSATARAAGLILADTKFEFGIDLEDQICLIDEVLTPDSSRFWPSDKYAPGRAQTAYDKQFVRDYLESLDWDKTPPGPELPAEVTKRTFERYWEALEKLTKE
ncbi:MAG: phosphoribosylaminoimidazolesuccinocarboxamide synthase [Opitutales bacterium]|nr:phosphoribosylaminoimidazolesuccinocarboxamide synthase [Opitutales bacterium]